MGHGAMIEWRNARNGGVMNTNKNNMLDGEGTHFHLRFLAEPSGFFRGGM